MGDKYYMKERELAMVARSQFLKNVNTLERSLLC